MKKGTFVGYLAGLALVGTLVMFRKRIGKFFKNTETEDTFWEGRNTYNISELLPDGANPMDKLR